MFALNIPPTFKIKLVQKSAQGLPSLQYCYHQHIYYILLISSCMSKGVLKKCLLRAKFRFYWIYASKNCKNLGDWHCNNFPTRSNSAKIFHISYCDIIMNTIWKNEAILRWSLPKSPYFRSFSKKLPLTYLNS